MGVVGRALDLVGVCGDHARMGLRVIPFDETMLTTAGRLLAQRHLRHRGACSLLPGDFEDAGVSRRAVEAAWLRSAGSGVAAVEGQELRGFLLPEGRVDTLRGRTAWVGLAAHALAETAPRMLYRELYAAAAQPWIETGHFVHHVNVPASDPAGLDAWFSLGFGMEQVHALLALSGEDLAASAASGPTPPDGVTVRRATTADRPELVRVADTIARWHTRPPVWAPAPDDSIAEIRAGIAAALSEDGVAFFIAERDGRVVGYQGYFPDPPTQDGLTVPPRCVELSVAATVADERRKGIARALMVAGLEWARDEGYGVCSTDWRSANLSAHSFWLARGFESVSYRLTRRIDPRVAWAR